MTMGLKCKIWLAIGLAAPSLSLAQSQDSKEKVATLLNLQGFLCARVVSISPLKVKDTYEVQCIEYRGGEGTVGYVLNAATGVAYKK